MRTGFWKELEDIKTDDPYASWGYLQNFDDEAIQCSFGPYNYLHGLCDAFAQALNERFGYDIEYVMEQDVDESIVLIHAYCVVECDGKLRYIDIRGITDDYEEFIDEFDIRESDIDGDYLYKSRNIKPISKYSFSKQSEYIKEANALIELYPDFYKVA